MRALPWIPSDAPPGSFPDPRDALLDPPGLLAAGGDLSPARLLAAYRRGIFPWYQAGQPILWWSPDPRAVLEPGRFHLARRLHRSLRRSAWTVTADRDFAGVLSGCIEGRPDTWLTDEMRGAYLALHRRGSAHSLEVWSGDQLAGGLYGLVIGRIFFAESMFSRRCNGSKAALFALCRLAPALGIALIDCQLPNPHLARLGAHCEPRTRFLERLPELLAGDPVRHWPASPQPIATLLPA